MTIVQGDDEHVDEPLEFVEVHHDINRIEFSRADGDLYAPVVAVNRLEGAVIEPKRMSRIESADRCDFERHDAMVVMLSDLFIRTANVQMEHCERYI